MITVAALVALGVLGVVLAVVGAFYSVKMLHLGFIPIPVGVLIAIVGNLAVCILGATGMESRLGAAVPAATWLVTTFILGLGRTEGDVVLPAASPVVGHLGEVFFYAGIAAATAGVVIGPLRGKHRPPGHLPPGSTSTPGPTSGR